MIAAPAFAASGIISGSARPAVTSLMIDAPASRAARATVAFEVSMEMNAEMFLRSCSMTGMTRPSSSSSEIDSAPGRVDSPPTSMIRAPSAAIRQPCSTALSVEKNSPPSEKESGVTLSTPMIMACPERSTVWPAIFQRIGPMVTETITRRLLL
jgi:hypothetical protein